MALTGSEAHSQCGALAEVPIACVSGGASVSFMAPLGRDKTESFWHMVADSDVKARSEQAISTTS